MRLYVSAGFREDGDAVGVGKRMWEIAREKVRAFGRDGKALTGPLQGCYRVTVGDWRCVYEFYDEDVVVILALAHRSEVYDVAESRREGH